MRIGALGVRMKGLSRAGGKKDHFPSVPDDQNGLIEGESTALLCAKDDDRPRFKSLDKDSKQSK